MEKSWWPARAVALLLFCATSSAFAQPEKDVPPPPPSKESAEGQRAMEGRKKAKPMPDPSNPVAPAKATPSGGLQGFDPTTGNATAKPTTTKSTSATPRHNKGDAAARPKKTNEAKPN